MDDAGGVDHLADDGLDDVVALQLFFRRLDAAGDLRDPWRPPEAGEYLTGGMRVDCPYRTTRERGVGRVTVVVFGALSPGPSPEIGRGEKYAPT